MRGKMDKNLIEDDSGLEPMLLADPESDDPGVFAYVNLLFMSNELKEHLEISELLLPPKLKNLSKYIEISRSEIKDLEDLEEKARRAEPGDESISPLLDQTADHAERAIDQMEEMRSRQIDGEIITLIWPSLYDHMVRESHYFVDNINDIKDGTLSMTRDDLVGFWGRIMAEHAFFTKHLLDPEEKNLIEKQDKIGAKFYEMIDNIPPYGATGLDPVADELDGIIDDGVKLLDGIQDGTIASIIPPDFVDHMRKETIYFKNELERIAQMTSYKEK